VCQQGLRLYLIGAQCLHAEAGKIMSIKNKHLRPGDKVHIPEDIMIPIDDVADVIVATKGSIGIVLSYEEYSDFILDPHKMHSANSVDHLAWVKLEMETGRHYPVRIEKFMPYKYNATPPTFVECHVGYITVLHIEQLEKIEQNHSKIK
jgi:hypothetical protein